MLLSLVWRNSIYTKTYTIPTSCSRVNKKYEMYSIEKWAITSGFFFTSGRAFYHRHTYTAKLFNPIRSIEKIESREKWKVYIGIPRVWLWIQVQSITRRYNKNKKIRASVEIETFSISHFFRVYVFFPPLQPRHLYAWSGKRYRKRDENANWN